MRGDPATARVGHFAAVTAEMAERAAARQRLAGGKAHTGIIGGIGSARWSALLVVAAATAWVGLFVHNAADLPAHTVLGAESLFPLLLMALLVVVWFVRARRFAAWALLVWGLLQLIGGGILSVLPLSILPFAPAQTIEHYLFHALYFATQLPLIVVTVAWLHRNPRRSHGSRN